MQNVLIKLFLIVITVTLAACSTTHDTISSVGDADTTQKKTVHKPAAQASDQNTIHEVNLGKTSASGELIGGSIEKMMDADDKLRMSRALDKSPGKTTTWQNPNTGISYAVTPVKKVVLRDNPFCREYRTTASKGEQSKEMTGTACVATDGNWHTVSHG